MNQKALPTKIGIRARLRLIFDRSLHHRVTPSQLTQARTQPPLPDRQVHPTARSKRPCRPRHPCNSIPGSSRSTVLPHFGHEFQSRRTGRKFKSLSVPRFWFFDTRKQRIQPPLPDRQVHPTARSKRPCAPDIHAIRFPVRPEVPCCPILDTSSSLAALGANSNRFQHEGFLIWISARLRSPRNEPDKPPLYQDTTARACPQRGAERRPSRMGAAGSAKLNGLQPLRSVLECCDFVEWFNKLQGHHTSW